MFGQLKLRASFGLGLGLLLGVSGTAHAQMTRSVLETLSVHPPVHAFNHSATSFPSVGSTDNFVAQNYAIDLARQSADDPQNVAYVKYVAPTGAAIKFTPEFIRPVPAVSGSTDSCFHAHLEYAAYAVQVTAIPFLTQTRVFFVVSGGEYGRRMLHGVEVQYQTPGAGCVVTSAAETFFPSVSGNFTWGSDSVTLPFASIGPSKITEFDVAAQATTHGWGDCGFFMCHPEVRLIAQRSQ